MFLDKFFLVLVLLGCHCIAAGQHLQIHLSYYPHGTVYLTAIQGTKKDTVGSVVLDSTGRGLLQFANNLTQPALAELTVKDKQYLSYQLVLSPTEKPSLFCAGEYVHSQNTTLTGSAENEALNRWFAGWMQGKEKTGLLQSLQKQYDSSSAFYRELQRQQSLLQQEDRLRWDTIGRSPLFAAQYMLFRKAQETTIDKVWESNEERKKARDYFNTVNLEALYASSLWFDIINACIEAYIKEGPYYQQFGPDVAARLRRLKNDKVYTALAEAALAICTRFSWQEDKQAVLNALRAAPQRLVKPSAELLKALD